MDVGCGEGTYSSLLKKNSNEVWGIEISDEAASIAKSKIDKVIIQDSENKWEVPSNYFDVVTMLRYLEHVYDFNFQLQEAKRVLKENGLLVVFSPNMSVLERVRLLFGRVPAYASDIEHIRQFTLPFLYKILKDNGFQPVYSRGTGFVLPKLNLQLGVIEKLFPNACTCVCIKALKLKSS